jgi:diguanylate cyclase (GGDEF)-like protein
MEYFPGQIGQCIMQHQNPLSDTSIDVMDRHELELYCDLAQSRLLSPLHLLIIEDVPEDVELITLALEAADLDFTYDTTLSVDHCQDLLNQTRYDCVLSDYRLPSFNGLQVFELLKSSGQDIPFILITGSLGEEAAVECIKRGMTDYVLKDRLFRLPMVLQRALEEFKLRHQQKAAIAQIQQQAWRETIVNRIIQAMRQTLVLEAVLQTTVDQLHEALQVCRSSIFQPQSEKSSASIIQYTSQQTPNRQSFLGITCDFYNCYQSDIANDIPVVIHDVNALSSATVRAIAANYEIQSVILMPLTYQNSYLGGICLQQCDRQRTWTQDEVTLVKAIADQCAIAIHQAQLYQQAQSELVERQKIEAQLRHDAFHDALTGLPNRALFMDRLSHVLQIAQRRNARQTTQKTYQFAVLFLDLDRFKVINDSLGHTMGDHLLRIVSAQLQNCLRLGDTVARLGGDEFVMLLEDIQDISEAVEVAKRIRRVLRSPILLDSREIFISASIGITLHSSNYTDPSHLLRDADTAMYRAKRRGRGEYEVFDSSMHTHALRQLQLESDLQRAIERNELKVHYQPIVDLKTQQVEGFEALVRWQHPEHGMIPPDEFIPIAEDTGLVVLIDVWVLQEACRQIQRWQQELPHLPPLTMNVNLSGKQFSHAELISQIDQALDASGIKGSQLKFEITESVLIENSQVATTILQELRSRQIQVCLDDFGTGYSSLSYLHRFPIDTLKIDRSFIALLEDTESRSEIVHAIINLALNMGLSVVAEGVETDQQLLYLKSATCHAAQGYYFSRPLASEDALDFLRTQSDRPPHPNPSS